MKKFFALLLCMMMGLACFAGLAEEAPEAAAAVEVPERTEEVVEYVLTAEPAYIENQTFDVDVVISGEAAQIIFSNCEFKGNIFLASEMGTQVLLMGCTVNGTCVIENEVTEADLNYNNPKFLTDAPVTVVCANGVGSVVAMGDFEVVFNGETYCMAEAQFFSDVTAPGNGLVPYEGQASAFCAVAQYYENGEKAVIVVNENVSAE